MRTAAFALLLVIAGVFASPPADAHGRRTHVHVGVGFGYWGPFWGPPWWHYPAPYYSPYYYPAPVVVQRAPVTYIEQGSSNTSGDSGGWWYYCDASKGYYPYVKECPSGWRRVPPAPAR